MGDPSFLKIRLLDLPSRMHVRHATARVCVDGTQIFIKALYLSGITDIA